jgi:hypothetical protein
LFQIPEKDSVYVTSYRKGEAYGGHSLEDMMEVDVSPALFDLNQTPKGPYPLQKDVDEMTEEEIHEEMRQKAAIRNKKQKTERDNRLGKDMNKQKLVAKFAPDDGNQSIRVEGKSSDHAGNKGKKGKKYTPKPLSKKARQTASNKPNNTQPATAGEPKSTTSGEQGPEAAVFLTREDSTKVQGSVGVNETLTAVKSTVNIMNENRIANMVADCVNEEAIDQQRRNVESQNQLCANLGLELSDNDSKDGKRGDHELSSDAEDTDIDIYKEHSGKPEIQNKYGYGGIDLL